MIYFTFQGLFGAFVVSFSRLRSSSIADSISSSQVVHGRAFRYIRVSNSLTNLSLIRVAHIEPNRNLQEQLSFPVSLSQLSSVITLSHRHDITFRYGSSSGLIMASCATTKTAAVKSFAVFVTFSVLQRCSSSSPGSVWEGNSHIARQFGFPFPFPLPKFNFSDVSEECQAIVQKLSSFSSPLFYSCEYGASNFQLFGQESRILALIVA